MGCGSGGIAHVMQTIKKRDEIEVLAGIILCRGDLEPSVARDAVLGGVRLSGIYRAWVKVVADKLRVRESLSHQHRGYAVPAPHIGDTSTAFEFRNHTIQSRKPIGDKVVLIAG